MTTRTTGRQPRGSRPAGGAGAGKKRPAAQRPKVEVTQVADVTPDADAVDIPPAVPPIDSAVLLRAIMTPPQGMDGGALTDALTGAVPTWRLDEEPIYLEVVRDLGVPALPDADGRAGDVIVGEVVA